jgi:uncharacterized membrane-anchored protein
MRLKFAALILFQVLLLVTIIGYRQYWVATGDRILLKSAPVDPRDIFRGDYVTLAYDISTIDLDKLGTGERFKRNDTIYAALDKKDDGPYRLDSVSRTMPSGKRFIRGRVTYVEEGAVRHEVTIREDDGTVRIIEAPWVSYKAGDRVMFCLDADGRVLTTHGADGTAGCRIGEALTGVVEAVKKIKYRRIGVDYGIEHFFIEEGKGRAIETARNASDLLVEVALGKDGQGLITGLLLGGKWIR